MIREVSPADASDAAALFSLVTPEFVTTAVSVHHNMTTTPPEAQRRWWGAERGGELVGVAHLGLVVETSEPNVGWFGVIVHPGERNQGIGTALSDLAEEHAASIGARHLHAWSRADAGTAAFARGRGFEQTGSSDLMVLDPRTVSPPDPPPGIELLPFTAFEDDPSPIHHVDSIATIDEPGDLTLDEISLELWLQNFWGHPLLDLDASTVAVVEGTPASVTFLQTDRDGGRGTNNGTGTLPELRGRGLAGLAKRASLTRAAELGITAVYTGNDVTNAPMQAINRKLGYAPCSTMLNWAKPGLVTTSG